MIPNSNLDASAERPISWRAVTLGAASAIALNATLGTAVALVAQWVLVWRGLSPQVAYASLFHSPGFIAFEHFFSFFYFAVGGSVASSLAASRPIAHGVAAGVASLLFSVVAFAGPMSNPLPFWSVAFWFAIPIPAAVFGAFLYARQA